MNENKQEAIKLIKRLWPTVTVDEDNVTPDVINFVFRVYASAQKGQKGIMATSPLIGTPTSFLGIALKVAQSIINYSKTPAPENYGLAMRAAVATYEHHIKNAMEYGTEVYPLPDVGN
jgi:hypothetical protein